MPSEKNNPVYTGNKKAQTTSDLVQSLPDLPPSEMASLCTKMNQAVALGIITLNSTQLACLKTLSSKYIPDSPKQINLNAKVQSEQIILNYLESNELLKEKAMQDAIDNKVDFPQLTEILSDELVKS